MTTMDPSMRALVLFSGGQDSTTCLAWALSKYQHVETIGFAYGQRHLIELESREPIRRMMCDAFPHWAERLGSDHLIDLGALNWLHEVPFLEILNYCAKLRLLVTLVWAATLYFSLSPESSQSNAV